MQTLKPLPGVQLLQLDVCETESIKQAVAAVVSAAGRIDILVSHYTVFNTAVLFHHPARLEVQQSPVQPSLYSVCTGELAAAFIQCHLQALHMMSVVIGSRNSSKSTINVGVVLLQVNNAGGWQLQWGWRDTTAEATSRCCVCRACTCPFAGQGGQSFSEPHTRTCSRRTIPSNSKWQPQQQMHSPQHCWHSAAPAA